MDLKRGRAGDDILWKLEGSLDDDSTLLLETSVLNSQYEGEDLIIDLSDMSSVSSQGLRSLDRIAHELKDKGAHLKVLPPEDPLEKEIKRIIED